MEIDQRETKKEEEGTKKEEEKKRDVRKICMKRTGEIVPFNYKKIEQAVAKAIHEVIKAQSKSQGDKISPKRKKLVDISDAKKVAKTVLQRLEEDYWAEGQTAAVEDVQDLVEETLMDLKFSVVAKTYILYRNERKKKREANAALMGELFQGRVDGLKLSDNAIRLLEQRYLARDRFGKILETPMEMFARVARFIAEAEEDEGQQQHWAKRFLDLLSKRAFLPASPVLMNAGSNRQLFPAFVFPLEDCIEDIYATLLLAIHTQKLGGGTGFDFSKIRPHNDQLMGSLLKASGPLSFLQIFAPALKTVIQSGRRQGANMGILRVDHPDILAFIGLKSRSPIVTNFNLSIAMTDKFMEAVQNDSEYETINPRTGEKHSELSARIVFDSILTSAWQCGDPGLLFFDRINRDNPVPEIGPIACTSPCAEMPMLPYESCPEGAINLICFIDDTSHQFFLPPSPLLSPLSPSSTSSPLLSSASLSSLSSRPSSSSSSSLSSLPPLSSLSGPPVFNWGRLKEAIHIAVRFLDNCHQKQPLVDPKIDFMTKGVRRIGLGVMGWADLLFALEIPYNSKKAIEMAKEMSSFIRREATLASEALAKERGPFEFWEKSIFSQQNQPPRRHGNVTCISPTGSISIIADVSGGIEPNFALSYVRNVVGGGSYYVANPFLLKSLTNYSVPKSVQDEVIRRGVLLPSDSLPSTIKDVFVTAQQIEPQWHVQMQAAWQENIDGAISKTINLPNSATARDVEAAILSAYHEGCKGITVYRDGSHANQILNVGT